MNVNKTFYATKEFKKSVKNVPNLHLKAGTFDASHLDQFIIEDQVWFILIIHTFRI